MNFRFSEEEESFRTEVREFIAAEMTEEVKSHWLGGLLDTPERQAFMTKMADRGWLSMGFPEEYGGTAAVDAAGAVHHEPGAAPGPQAPIVGKNLGVIVNTLLHHGSEKLKQEFIPRIMRNEIQWALAYSEPEAGSDLANMQMPRRAGRRRVGRERPEALHHLRALLRLPLDRRPHRPRCARSTRGSAS